MTLAQVEQKLAVMEREIQQLKLQAASQPRSGKWYVDHAGQFRNDPVYAEIVRLGRKYRESLRPKRAGKKKR